jgi:hypothetical protein
MSHHDQTLFHRAVAEATAAPKGRNAGPQKNPRGDAILPSGKSSGNASRQQQRGAKSSVPSTRPLSHAELTEKYKGKPEVGVIEPARRHLSLCTFWLQGTCRNGDACTFLHDDIEEKRPICKYFKEQGFCLKGEQCYYRHTKLVSEIDPVHGGDDGLDAVGKGRFPSLPGPLANSELCPYYERGFCYKGFECRFAA